MKYFPFIVLFLFGCSGPNNNSKVGFESNPQDIESTSARTAANIGSLFSAGDRFLLCPARDKMLVERY